MRVEPAHQVKETRAVKEAMQGQAVFVEPLLVVAAAVAVRRLRVLTAGQSTLPQEERPVRVEQAEMVHRVVIRGQQSLMLVAAVVPVPQILVRVARLGPQVQVAVAPQTVAVAAIHHT